MTACRSFHWRVAVVVLCISACSTTAPRTWTNCSQSQGCDQAAILDVYGLHARDILDADGRSLGSGSADREDRHRAGSLFLTPGTYTVLSWYHDETGWTTQRQDSFQAEAGVRYEGRNKSCNDWIPFGPARCPQDASNASTLWIEDVASSRVVAGAKWCRKDADCPLSTCAKEAGRPVGVCAIAGIECKSAPMLYWSGALIGETGRCGPVAAGGRSNDWPGFPNFEPATPPDAARGLVYLYGPEMEAALTSGIQVGPTASPARIVKVGQGGYVPLYVRPGRLNLSIDDAGAYRPVPASVTLDVVVGQTYYVRGMNRLHAVYGLHGALEVVGRDEALAELRHCRLIGVDDLDPADGRRLRAD